MQGRAILRTDPDILVVGALHWDIIGLSNRPIAAGGDIAGQILRQPGGVGLNIARALSRFGLSVGLVSAVGQDGEGVELLAATRAMGIACDLVLSHDLPTDHYMAIEGPGGLIAALADAHSLEAAGEAIVRRVPADSAALVIDSNLTEAALALLAAREDLAHVPFHLAPASPDKVMRLRPFLNRPSTSFYLNRAEAGLLAGREIASATEGARVLSDLGLPHVLVTDGSNGTAEALGGNVLVASAPKVQLRHVTGAGDMFMAAHIAATRLGLTRQRALDLATQAASRHVAGEVAEKGWLDGN